MRHIEDTKPDWEIELDELVIGKNLSGKMLFRDVWLPLRDGVKSFIRAILESERERLVKDIEKVGEAIMKGNSLEGKCPECKNPNVIVSDSDMKVKEMWAYKKIMRLLTQSEHKEEKGRDNN